MHLAPGFVDKVSRIFGDTGRAWLHDLPAIVASCRELWHLPQGTICDVVAMSYIEFTALPDGTPVALKIIVPHEELYTEMESLALTQGRGAVRLIAADRDLGAVLLQRAVPGTMLWQHGNNREQTRIAAEAMKALHIPEPAHHGMPHFSRWVERAFRLTRSEWDPEERMPRDLLDRAEQVFASLTDDRSHDVVLHGDLHHENLLWDETDGWIVIDPKGVIGPHCLEVGRFIQNQLPDKHWSGAAEALVRERIEVLHEVLEIEPEDLAAAALVDCVLGHVWSFEDNGPLHVDWYRGIDLARFLVSLLPDRPQEAHHP